MTETRSGLSSARYAFGPFVVDALTRTMWRDGQVVPITAKTLDVLLVLLESRNRTIQKDKLISLVWANTVVHENNLARQVSSLRRALGQRSDQHDYIVTIPGEGYRFVAAVDTNAGTTRTGVSTSPPLEETGRPHKSRLPLRAIIAAAAGVAAAGLVTLFLTRDRESLPPRVLQRVTYDDAALARDPVWSADGRSVVYVSNSAGSADLWRQQIGSADPERVTTSDSDETQPASSPDGQWIAFRSEQNGGGLYVMRAGGGTQRRVADFGYEPRWSPDGDHILFKRSAVLPNLPGIYVVGLDGLPPRPLRPDVLDRFRTLHAAWHPDGQHVSIWGSIGWTERAFLTVPISGGDATIAEISDEVHRGLADLSPGQFVWAPSRRFIYFEAATRDARNVWRVTVDPRTGRWVAGPEPLTTGPGDATSLAISADGKRLLLTTTSSRTRLWAFPFDIGGGRISGEPYPVTDGSTGEVDFDVRADGSTLVYRTVRAGRNELWERSIAAGRQRLLLSTLNGRVMKPRWSPDGAQLAFSKHGGRDDGLTVAVLNSDGTGEHVVTNPADFDMSASDWSRDGRAILGDCRFRGSDRTTTCLVPLSDSNQSGDPARVRVIASDPDRNLYNQRFSPDQRWISFLAHDLWRSATSTVYVVPISGGNWIPVTEGAWFDDKPAWSPDGRALYFISNRTGIANVWGRWFDPARGTTIGEPFPVTSFQSARFALTAQTVQMDIAVTTNHLLLPMSESRSDVWMLDAADQ